MIERGEDDGIHFIDFSPVLVANLLPFAEIVLSETGFTINMVFLLYWFEILTLFLVYCGCALFAQQEQVTDGQEENADDGVLSTLPTVQFHRSLPAVQLRNLGVSVQAALIIGVWIIGIGDWVISSHEAYGAFPSWLSAFTTPAMFVPALGIIAAHLVYVYRNYFRRRRYRELSPQGVLDGPIRLALLFSLTIIVWFFMFALIGGLTLAMFSRPAAELVAKTVLFGGFLLLKVGIEWIRFRAKHTADPSGLAAWLTPKEPRSASQD